jgi:hypothetical protein
LALGMVHAVAHDRRWRLRGDLRQLFRGERILWLRRAGIS